MEYGFEEASKGFLLWLKQRPDALINPKVGLADLRHRGAGRGVGMALLQR